MKFYLTAPKQTQAVWLEAETNCAVLGRGWPGLLRPQDATPASQLGAAPARLGGSNLAGVQPSSGLAAAVGAAAQQNRFLPIAQQWLSHNGQTVKNKIIKLSLLTQYQSIFVISVYIMYLTLTHSCTTPGTTNKYSAHRTSMNFVVGLFLNSYFSSCQDQTAV